MADEMARTRVRGVHRIEVRDTKGRIGTASVELRYRRLHVLPPIGKQTRYPALDLTLIHARERGSPIGRPAIDWRLITDLPVSTRAAVVEKLHWYSQRWKIELFHKILKSGCRVEEARLRTAERLVRLIAVFCILSSARSRCARRVSAKVHPASSFSHHRPLIARIAVHLRHPAANTRVGPGSDRDTLSTSLSQNVGNRKPHRVDTRARARAFQIWRQETCVQAAR